MKVRPPLRLPQVAASLRRELQKVVAAAAREKEALSHEVSPGVGGGAVGGGRAGFHQV